jgi:hypothetical protein
LSFEMRPKFLLVLFAVILVIAGGIVLVKRDTTKPAPVVDATSVTTAPVNAPTPTAPVPAPAPEAVVTKPPETPEEHQAAVDAEVSQLNKLSYKNNAASLAAIEADLTSPEKSIRVAAIEAAKQFGDTNAIPVLRGDAASSQDMDEQIAMLQAAQFLAVPEADLNATNSNPIPATPEQIQAAQQKYAAIQARQQARSGRSQNSAQSSPSGTPPSTPGN